MILFIRDNECFEPRVKSYLNYFDANGIDYHVIAWNRNGTATPNDKITFFERRAEYGKRLANIPNKLAWMSFVRKEIKKHKDDCTVIHACDVDAILPALGLGKRYKKKVVFDIFDWISSLTGKGVVYKAVEFVQNNAYKKSDVVILCEEERKAQAKTTNDNILVLPNIPAAKVEYVDVIKEKVDAQRAGYDFTVSYVGVFDRDRGLENLLECVSRHPNVLLNIAGFGVLGEDVERYSKEFPNICNWGRVDYAVGQTIMKNSDLIAAMYHLTSPLHKFAAPNKYYESLYLEVPMITTENTLVASKVAKYDTGFILDETYDSLSRLFDDETLKAQIAVKSVNCKNTWEQVYVNYYENFMQTQYLKILGE